MTLQDVDVTGNADEPENGLEGLAQVIIKRNVMFYIIKMPP